MVFEAKTDNGSDDPTRKNLAYIRSMLGELRLVADKEGAEMLCYLIEMAYVEAGDVLNGTRSLSISRKPTARNLTRP